MQGGQHRVIHALAEGDLNSAPVTNPERQLLEFVELVTRHAYRVTDADTDRLRTVGWTDPQIAEAVYITALFAFFNRVADAFGLEDPGYRELYESGERKDIPKANRNE